MKDSTGGKSITLILFLGFMQVHEAVAGFELEDFQHKSFGCFHKTGPLSFSGRKEVCSCEVIARFTYGEPTFKYDNVRDFFSKVD